MSNQAGWSAVLRQSLDTPRSRSIISRPVSGSRIHFADGFEPQVESSIELTNAARNPPAFDLAGFLMGRSSGRKVDRMGDFAGSDVRKSARGRGVEFALGVGRFVGRR
jgi:hypothetical protein